MRLGVHVNTNRGHAAAIDYCGAVQPAMMKWMEPDPGVIAECIRRSPTTRHVLRQYWSEDRQTIADYPAFQSQALSRTAHVLNALRGAGIATSDALGPRIWMEGYNESIGKGADPSRVRDFAGKEVGLARALNGLGAGALVGGFSTGFLDEGLIDPFREALRYCHDNPRAAALHFHEYAAPFLAYMVETPDGRNQWRHIGGVFTGTSATREAYYQRGLTGWLTLRYRKLMPLLDRAGLGRVRFAVTESGNDDTPPRPGGQGSGWRNWQGTEWERTPLGDYADQLHWYLWQITADADRFLGVVDFGFGTLDPRWDAFDLSQDRAMLGRVVRRQLELPALAVGTPTAPPTPPPPPAPAPPPVALPPTISPGVVPVGIAQAGESWAQLAGRMHGHPSASWAYRLAWAMELRTFNGLPSSAGLVAGRAYRSPWHKVEVAP